MSQDKKKEEEKKNLPAYNVKGAEKTRQDQIDRAGVGKYVSNEINKFWDDRRKHTV